MATSPKKKLSILGASAAIASIIVNRRKRRRSRKSPRAWTRPWILLRSHYGAYHCLLRELKLCDKPSYRNFLRMDELSFSELLSKVEPLIKKQDTNMRDSIPPEERLALTLRYLASGDSYSSLQYLYWIPKQTISRVIPEVCEAIYKALADDYLKMPSNAEDWVVKAEEFGSRWQFFNCIGALDGKHVVIQAPENSGSYYFNYKGTFSIVLLAVADADYKFTYVDVGCNGRISDGGVFKNSSLGKALEADKLDIKVQCKLPGISQMVPYTFVADDAFPLKTNVMKPFSLRGLTKEQRIFNYRLSRARRIVENAFGILANRFRIFMKPIALHPNKVESLVLACITLHNFLRAKVSSRALYAPHGSFDREDTSTGTFRDGSWRPIPLMPGIKAKDKEPQGLVDITDGNRGRHLATAKDVRNTLCEYFNSDVGQVPWQWKMVETGIDWQ